MSSARILEAIHGHLGILAAAALIHPALLLRAGKPLSSRQRLVVAACALLVVAVFGSGLLLYPEYVTQVKVGLFLRSVRAGQLFETKEHLAYAVLCNTLGASACALLAPKQSRGLRRAAAVLFAVGAALCLLVVGLGIYIAAVHGFGGSPPPGL